MIFFIITYFKSFLTSACTDWFIREVGSWSWRHSCWYCRGFCWFCK